MVKRETRVYKGEGESEAYSTSWELTGYSDPTQETAFNGAS